MKESLILTNPSAREGYLQRQVIAGTPEQEAPIHIGTNLGISRDMVSAGMMQQSYGEVHPLYRTWLEIYVPSMDTIRAATSASTEFDKLVCKLHAKAVSHGITGNMRDMHGNVWEEKFMVFSGTMDFVQFEITDAEKPEMQANNGSLYSITNRAILDRVLKTKRHATVEKLSAGDVFYSPPGYVHGVIEAHDAHYVVDIIGRDNWLDIAMEIYGRDSPKVTQLREASGSWANQASAVHGGKK